MSFLKSGIKRYLFEVLRLNTLLLYKPMIACYEDQFLNN